LLVVCDPNFPSEQEILAHLGGSLLSIVAARIE
jgi:hypothetical protein